MTNSRNCLICSSLLASFFFIEVYKTNSFNSLHHAASTFFHLTPVQFGWLSAIYLLAYVIFLLPAGLLLDKMNFRPLMAGMVLLCAASNFAVSLTSNYHYALFFLFLSGIGASFAFIGAMRYVSFYFSKESLAKITGLIVAFAMIGGMLAQSPTRLLVHAFSWRIPFQLTALFELCLAILIVWRLRNVQIHEPIAFSKLLRNLWQSLTKAIFYRYSWIGGIYTSCLNLPVTLLGAVWGQIYLESVGKMSAIHAANATGLIFIGIIIGSPVWGKFSDTIRNRKLPMLIGALLSFLTIGAIILFTPIWPSTLNYVAFFLLGLFSSAQVLGYAVVSDYAPINIKSAALSVAALSIMVTDIISQPLYGWLLSLNSPRCKSDFLSCIAPSSFSIAMLMLPIVFLFASVLVLLIRKPNTSVKKLA